MRNRNCILNIVGNHFRDILSLYHYTMSLIPLYVFSSLSLQLSAGSPHSTKSPALRKLKAWTVSMSACHLVRMGWTTWVTPWERWICRRRTARMTTATSSDVLPKPQSRAAVALCGKTLPNRKFRPQNIEIKQAHRQNIQSAANLKRAKRSFISWQYVTALMGEGVKQQRTGIRRGQRAAAWLKVCGLKLCLPVVSFLSSITDCIVRHCVVLSADRCLLLHYRAWQTT